MCGIAGFAGPGNEDDLKRMTGALAHRGPDSDGFHVDVEAHVFLGHRRLSILDLEGGHQPMWSADGQIAVIFNGEIYNHGELRKRLEAAGHQFCTSHSDTEVLIHGYEEWGRALPGRLNGMFAFAVYDKGRGCLFLSRDRFGEKPLYYAGGAKFFAFASELSALIHHPLVSATEDIRSLQRYFALGYLPAPDALYENTNKLPGGCSLLCNLKNGEVKVETYWKFRLEPDETMGRGDEKQLAEELRELITRSVERRLISDVPLGVFLSGGLDSSIVTAAAASRLGPGELKTFTIGFTEPSFDESPFARQIATQFGTDHRQRILDLDVMKKLAPGVLDRLDEPLGDASIMPTFLLCAFAKEHVTVALSGDGGDELFAGYDPFKALKLSQWYDRLVPGLLHKGLRRLADLLPKSHRNMSLDFKIRRALTGLSYPQNIWLPVWMSPLEPDAMQDLFEAPVHMEDLFQDIIALWEESSRESLVDKTLEFFTNFYLQDDILMKSDRAAMMSSLETRAIFLDNDLVDFCRRLPARFKYRNGERKYLLKKAFEDVLPRTIVNRRKKGFGIPLSKWLQSMPYDLTITPISGVHSDFAEGAWAEHRRGVSDHRLFLWSWLSMQHVLTARPGAAV